MQCICLTTIRASLQSHVNYKQSCSSFGSLDAYDSLVYTTLSLSPTFWASFAIVLSTFVFWVLWELRAFSTDAAGSAGFAASDSATYQMST